MFNYSSSWYNLQRVKKDMDRKKVNFLKKSNGKKLAGIAKTPTGIRGFDIITGGGLPKGRPTLICGGPGCGKTLFGIEFLVQGAVQFNEPGVFVTFEETEEALATNVASLGFDLKKLISEKKLFVDYIKVERSEIQETGAYDLEGLFIRLDQALKISKAKRLVLDTIESLFSGLSNTAILRAEIRRLFHWLAEKGITVIITGERGEGTLTRQGLEEYVSDCVILLDHRVVGQVSTRRLRIVKYRGSHHGTNEYPFLIDSEGISVVPITSVSLGHIASSERVSSGIPRLDSMLGGKGYYRGSSILVSGTAGTGKSSVGAHFARASCKRGEKCLYFTFEESPSQIIRNMKSIGIDFAPLISSGHLMISASRPTMFGLEMHLAKMHKEISEFKPNVVIVDPITNLISAGSSDEVSLMLMRLIDTLKGDGITAVFTSLTQAGHIETSDVGVSSLMDTWIMLEDIRDRGERKRGIHVLKSRGMAHSNQIKEFLIGDKGIEIAEGLRPETSDRVSKRTING
jgi:circadian clock protein KaiC